ncbi:hypothetical protein Cob_v006470 [Colletotrichum orbiculare MAFF 240422]|uniref:Uncharacterized protein n=1 Tax=Colletotrichum orbiculare (strain 104-T / ATCC 96160 / CBS 514.97 / LARS 414 / MAFF 240422) TaxID=1213857 RepID=A0A484FR97_COLOR|nr:hypothetical protein Cob_v006470 [Colletotrichum orbiculare MAFF 240422]
MLSRRRAEDRRCLACRCCLDSRGLGSGARRRASRLFQAALQRDAAWQMAIEEGFRRNIILAESWARKRGNPLNHRDRNGDDLNNWYMLDVRSMEAWLGGPRRGEF